MWISVVLVVLYVFVLVMSFLSVVGSWGMLDFVVLVLVGVMVIKVLGMVDILLLGCDDDFLGGVHVVD